MPPHLDKPEGHLAQGRSRGRSCSLARRCARLLQSLIWDGNFFLQPRQSHPQEPSLSLLGKDFAYAQLGCAVCSHSLHQGPQGLEHCTPSFPSSFLCQGSQLLGVQVLNPSLFRVKGCWVLATQLGCAPCLSWAGVHRGFWQSSPWACFEVIHPSREFIISCLWSSPCT